MLDNGTYLYEKMIQDSWQLGSGHSSLSVYSIGRSVMGRELLLLRCGCGPRHIGINAAFHANEWITSALLMRFVAELAEQYKGEGEESGDQMPELCRSTTLWVVPMVNPDGAELVQRGLSSVHPHWRDKLLAWNEGRNDFSGWKANIRGVDLNDQFPAYWEEERKRRGVPGPASRDYPGPFPLSEPEAVSMERLTESLRFDAVLALHTQGREIYWNYRDYEPPHAENLAEKLGAASGYKPVKLSGSDAGYKDWFIRQYRKPGFTVEVGLGENPLPAEMFDELYAELKPLLLEAMLL
ncbi:M14 family metallopeptidase [Paenibacillus sp. CAU 1782]